MLSTQGPLILKARKFVGLWFGPHLRLHTVHNLQWHEAISVSPKLSRVHFFSLQDDCKHISGVCTVWNVHSLRCIHRRHSQRSTYPARMVRAKQLRVPGTMNITSLSACQSLNCCKSSVHGLIKRLWKPGVHPPKKKNNKKLLTSMCLLCFAI